MPLLATILEAPGPLVFPSSKTVVFRSSRLCLKAHLLPYFRAFKSQVLSSSKLRFSQVLMLTKVNRGNRLILAFFKLKTLAIPSMVKAVFHRILPFIYGGYSCFFPVIKTGG
jgi:hypothetical protein